MDNTHILLIGASVRAASFSALRAGLSPCCIDLFADADLAAVCPTQRLTTRYPHGFEDVLAKGPSGPWMYTGGLENYPHLINRMSRQRPLWGNSAYSLSACRDPLILSQILIAEGIPVPEIGTPISICDIGKRWLVKPRRGAGGAGVHFLERGKPVRPEQYVQEYIEGESCSAVFVGAGEKTRLLGLTRQLVGVDWLYARPFQYCGSVGPMSLSADANDRLECLGRTLARQCKLVGLFGVDGIMRNEIFYVVEVNPRYTASVEVIEYATGVRALDWHRHACTGQPLITDIAPQAIPIVGKAIVFAARDIVVPAHSPWQKDVERPFDPWRVPKFADVPSAGALVRARQPILTVLAEGPTPQHVVGLLRRAIDEVEAAWAVH